MRTRARGFASVVEHAGKEGVSRLEELRAKLATEAAQHSTALKAPPKGLRKQTMQKPEWLKAVGTREYSV
jgi:hypothetical protein